MQTRHVELPEMRVTSDHTGPALRDELVELLQVYDLQLIPHLPPLPFSG